MRVSDWRDIVKISATLPALAGGVGGAVTLTLLHESVRRLRSDAPRSDILGMRAIARGMAMFGRRPPPREQLYRWSLVGDLLSNAAYYSLVGRGSWRRAAALGLAAGIGAVKLPGVLGLGNDATRRSDSTAVMTVAWYVAGAMSSWMIANLIDRET